MAFSLSAYITLTFAFGVHAQPDVLSISGDFEVTVSGTEQLNLYQDTDRRLLLKTVNDYCEYYNTCNGSEIHNISDQVQRILDCCIPCDCTDDCFARGTCCRDKTGDVNRTDTGELLTPEREICTTVPNIGAIDPETKPKLYLLVQSCFNKKQCADLQPTTIDNMVPVVSETSGLSYLNAHCARCNFEQGKLLPWGAVLSCKYPSALMWSQLVHKETHNISTLLLQRSCSIKWIPQNNSKPCTSKAEPDTCRDTMYDGLCTSRNKGLTYWNQLTSNVFCSGCLASSNRFCTLEQPDTLDESFGSFFNWEIFEHFEAFFSTEPPVVTNDNPEQGMCEPIYWEPGHCHLIVCLRSHLYYAHGKMECREVASVGKGVCLQYRIKAFADSALFPAEGEENMIEKALVIGFETQSAQVSNVFFLSKYTNTSIRIFHIYLTMESKKSLYLEKEYKAFEENMQNFQQIFPLTIEYDTENVSFDSLPMDSSYYISFRETIPTRCAKRVAMSPLQFCIGIYLVETDFYIVDKVLMLKDGIKFQPHEYVDISNPYTKMNDKYVCLVDYQSKMYGLSKSDNLTTSYKNTAIALSLLLDYLTLTLFTHGIFILQNHVFSSL